MTRIAVIADAHANLPALHTALHAIEKNKCDHIVHIGDAISIGPHPAECVELLINNPKVICTKGNHEDDLCNGLPDIPPQGWSASELHHYRWTHKQLNSHQIRAIRTWPHVHEIIERGLAFSFQHYALAPDKKSLDFSKTFRNPTAEDLATLFDRESADLIFYGHDHQFSDRIVGAKRCINPGSLGCFSKPIARFTIATVSQTGCLVEHFEESYDDAELNTAFIDRQVPDADFIRRTFFGNRWGLIQ